MGEAAELALERPVADRIRSVLPGAIGLGLFLVAVFVLRQQLRSTTWPDVVAAVVDTPRARVIAAIVLTVVNYAVLTGYDFLAFAYIGKWIRWHRIALASFVAYAISNNVGFAIFSGASVRYRFYTRWGVTAEQLSRLVFSYALTFWLGLLLLGGLSLALRPVQAVEGLPAAPLVTALGWLFVGAALAYVIATLVRRAPIRIGSVTVRLPAPRIAAAQVVVSAADWALAASVLYVLLPSGQVSFLTLTGAFVAAQLIGLASHVPGGVGVFEGLMVVLLESDVDSSTLLPALIVYRAIYYLLPMAAGVVILVVDEIHLRRAHAARASALVGEMTEQLTPRALAAFTFLSGLLLLFSNATPAAADRLAFVNQLLPLGVIEISHFLGSIVGAALLLLSQGLARRLDAAYLLTAVAISIGIVASLLKGAGVEEATALAIVLVLLWRARPAFDRRATLFETRFSPGWVIAVLTAVSASVWLGFFAFKHVEYSNELWWQFALHADASRFLRATVGTAVALLLFGFARLMAPAPHDIEVPSDQDLEDCAAIVRTQNANVANLVLLRDKAVLFDVDRKAFLMYGVQGRTWVALGDPVGPPDRSAGLIRAFLERCDDYNAVPVFYEVGKDQLHRYADFGLTFVKLGEEARVDLQAFALEGGRARRYRQVLRSLEKEQATFRIVPAEDVPAIVDQLRAVSDDWLQHKRGAEKGFSLGFFEPAYLSRFPVAIVERHGEIVAFANIWRGADRAEISLDLMRYHSRAPKDVMDSLFVHMLVWAKAEGYAWFSLGMAPLSGFERSPVAPLWTRLGSFVYQHGAVFYNFQGLRAYKEKFHPEWEPRYLVYPGGLRLPQILADVAALVAGGYRRLLPRRDRRDRIEPDRRAPGVGQQRDEEALGRDDARRSDAAT